MKTKILMRVTLVMVLAHCSMVAKSANLDETAGDFSNDRLAPTDWSLTYGQGGSNGLFGNNILSGSIGATLVSGVRVIERDYIHLVVPSGFFLDEIRVGTQTTFGGTGSFIGIATGSSISINPDTASNAAGLLGYRIYGASDLGNDILDDMSIATNGSTGFIRPLPSGDYTVWIQELAVTGPFSYRFNFMVSPVPEPQAYMMIFVGLAVVTLANARRRNASIFASVIRLSH